ncbi:MAG: ABC transporter substrate-binding protein [Actinomycetota bacterium]
MEVPVVVVRLGAVFLAAALVAAACTATPEPTSTITTLGTTTTLPPTSTTTEPPITYEYGGVAIVAEDEEPSTLNPYVRGGEEQIVSTIGQAYFTGVSDVDGRTLELIPEVVVDLPSTTNEGVIVNEDGTMTVHYTIREEAVWEDGVPISGDDFAFTLETLQGPRAHAGYRIEDVYGWVESFEAGPKTFSFTLNRPTILHEQLFRVLLPKHAVEGSDFVGDWNETMWPSGGPFRLSEWERGSHLTVERNDAYWKTDPESFQQLPFLDAVEFRFVTDLEQTLDGFIHRTVDILEVPSPVQEIDELIAMESRGARVDVRSGPVWEHLSFQFGPGRLEMNEGTLNHNLDFRRAVAHLIDREAIAAVVSSQATPMSSYIDAFTPALSHHSWDRYEYDPAKAAELLEQVKADEGVETVTAVFTTSNRGDIRIEVSEALRAMFESVGVVYENRLQDPQIFYGPTLEKGQWDLGQWAWVGTPGVSGLVGIHDVFDPEGMPPRGSNYYRWGTEDSSVIDENTDRFSKARDLMNATVDDTQLLDLFAEAEEILADQMVILPLYTEPAIAVVWEDEIAGFVHNPSRASYTWNMEEWRRADL